MKPLRLLLLCLLPLPLWSEAQTAAVRDSLGILRRAEFHNAPLATLDASAYESSPAAMLYRYAQYYTMLAELRYHRKDYSGALTALNTLAQRAYGKANFHTDSSAAAIHDYNPYRYVDGLGQCGIDTSRPNQLLMPVSKKAMNKNNKITQTQGWS